MTVDRMTERLNAPRLFITNFAYPTTVAQSLDTTNSPDTTSTKVKDLAVPHGTEKVHVQVSSELSSIPRHFNLFGNAGPSQKESRRKLSLIHDLSGQPMIFSVSNTGKLYCLCFVNGAGAGWQSFVVTPPSKSATTVVDAFDTLELDNKIHLVVSMECPGQDESDIMKQELWYTTFEKPSLSVTDGHTISGISHDFLQWKQFATALLDRQVTSVLCCPSVKSKYGFHALIGTAVRDNYAATHYIVDPAAPDGTWKNLVMSGSAEELLCMQPIVTGTGRYREIGVVSAYRQTGGNTQQACTAEIFDEESMERVLSYTLQAGKLGSVNQVYSSLNPKGSTDIVVAGSKGIGFFDSTAINELRGAPIMPEISFKQVVCSENVKDDESNILAIFAISERDELYFIQGCRTSADGEVTFRTSGLPIRTGVAVMSPQYNQQTNACEILYVTNEVNSGLRHLIRDPISSLWTDGVVEFKVPLGEPGKRIKEPVYLTNIALSDSTGKGVPDEYPVIITASPAVHVTCNGRSLLLNHIPYTVLTNQQGHIDLALPADSSMSCSQLQLSLIKFKPDNGIIPTGCIEINPAQRVVNIMSTLKDKDAMKQATGPDKNPVFDDESVDDAGPLVTHFSMMAQHVSGNSLKDEAEKKAEDASRREQDERDHKKKREAEEKIQGTCRTMIQLERNQDSWVQNLLNEVEDTVEEVVDVVTEFLGEVIECIKENVAKVTTLVLKTIGPSLVMFIKVAGKMFSIEIPGIGPLLGTVFGFLKDLLKNTFPKLYAFLQVLFDGETTTRAQTVFYKVIVGAMDHAENFIEENASNMADWLDGFQGSIKEFIPDSQMPTSDPSTDEFLARATSVMNNPIVKILLDLNPMSWLEDGITQGLSDYIDVESIKIPSPSRKLVDIMLVLDGVGTNVLSKLLSSIISSFSGLASEAAGINPTNLKEVLFMLGGFISSMKELLTEEWTIPGLTDVWKDLTGLEFSILNFLTYISAVVWKAIALLPSLIFGDSESISQDMDHMLEEMEKIDVSSIPTFQMKSSQHTTLRKEGFNDEMPTLRMSYQSKSSGDSSVAVKIFKSFGRVSRSLATYLEIRGMHAEEGKNKVYHAGGEHVEMVDQNRPAVNVSGGLVMAVGHLAKPSLSYQISSTAFQGFGTLMSIIAFTAPVGGGIQSGLLKVNSTLQCIGSILSWRSEWDEDRSVVKKIAYWADLGGAVSGLFASITTLIGLSHKAIIYLLQVDLVLSGCASIISLV
ncbi:hypothetical protein N7454_001025 [Penicillium verhagenii]|nr:hypothetical protein N7454_001025 [Penicillium verhagenii]